MLLAIIILTLLGLTLGILLGAAASFFAVEGNPLEAEIEALLPGSQCGQCGYPGCTPAAAALAKGEAKITLCPPGGRNLAQELAAKLGVSADLSDMEDSVPMIARIREELCIGCTKCFKCCPTDAIIGGPKQLHAVISDACTGCEKCFEVCPTECIDMHPIPITLQNWYWPKPAIAA
jgi:electron transport complex protein RnfB